MSVALKLVVITQTLTLDITTSCTKHKQASAKHASACADMLLEAVEVLSADDNGELLLQPIGHCPELVNGLVAVAVDGSMQLERRTDAARVIIGLLQKVTITNCSECTAICVSSCGQ
jgi:hypothetical protein